MLYSNARQKYKDAGTRETSETIAEDQFCRYQIHLPAFCQVIQHLFGLGYNNLIIYFSNTLITD